MNNPQTTTTASVGVVVQVSVSRLNQGPNLSGSPPWRELIVVGRF